MLTGFIGFSHDCRTYKYRVRHGQAISLKALEEVHGSPITELARCSGAIGRDPLFQWIDMDLDGNRECTWTVPTPFLFFGYYTKIKTPRIAPQFNMERPLWVMGEDIQRELMSDLQVPVWEHNEYGNAYVPHLGNIEMLQVD